MFIVTIIALMLGGVWIGYLNRSRKFGFIHRFIVILIWLLLFLLGMEVGSNDAIIRGIHVLGWEALVITLAAVIGSAVASWGLWLYINKEEGEAGS